MLCKNLLSCRFGQTGMNTNPKKKMTGETPEVRSNKRKPREEKEREKREKRERKRERKERK